MFTQKRKSLASIWNIFWTLFPFSHFLIIYKRVHLTELVTLLIMCSASPAICVKLNLTRMPNLSLSLVVVLAAVSVCLARGPASTKAAKEPANEKRCPPSLSRGKLATSLLTSDWVASLSVHGSCSPSPCLHGNVCTFYFIYRMGRRS